MRALAARDGMDPIEVISSLFANEGAQAYLGEAVSVSVHMRQAGALAEAAGAPDQLVAAKRYLCAVDPGYMRRLSAASLYTLGLQGGAMSLDEAQAFARLPYAEAAIAVRRWDEAAKDPHVETPDFAHFRPVLERVLRG